MSEPQQADAPDRVRPVQEQIDSIMDNFDFAKVERVMRMLNLRWVRHPRKADGPDEYYQPDEHDLRRTARKLLKEVAAQQENTFMGQGGFMVHQYGGALSLYFVLESMDGD
jgi:hypothetical protein